MHIEMAAESIRVILCLFLQSRLFYSSDDGDNVNNVVVEDLLLLLHKRLIHKPDRS